MDKRIFLSVSTLLVSPSWFISRTKLNAFLRLTVLLILLLYSASLLAKDYNASLFGIKSNGTTLNTTSIQKTIDYINENGGGRLVFYVGRYLTGTIHLKSNVTIQLEDLMH